MMAWALVVAAAMLGDSAGKEKYLRRKLILLAGARKLLDVEDGRVWDWEEEKVWRDWRALYRRG